MSEAEIDACMPECEVMRARWIEYEDDSIAWEEFYDKDSPMPEKFEHDDTPDTVDQLFTREQVRATVRTAIAKVSA